MIFNDALVLGLADLLINIIVFAWLIDKDNERKRRDRYMQRGLEKICRFIGLKVEFDRHDGEMYVSEDGYQMQPISLKSAKAVSDEANKRHDERFNALARHLKIGFKREQTPAVDTLVVVKK